VVKLKSNFAARRLTVNRDDSDRFAPTTERNFDHLPFG
jgi:hypothetical protein